MLLSRMIAIKEHPSDIWKETLNGKRKRKEQDFQGSERKVLQTEIKVHKNCNDVKWRKKRWEWAFSTIQFQSR